MPSEQKGASREQRISYGLLFLAALVGLPSLLYPWGGDFAIFDYVAGTIWR